MFAGLGAARVRRLFRIARKNEPAIIFIDELDAVGGHRGLGLNGEKDQTLNQLLIEMDGFSSSRPPRRDRGLQPARPARHRRCFAPAASTARSTWRRPTCTPARRSCACTCRDKPVGDVDLALVARQTAGLTGADLANICNEAAIFAARRDAATISDRGLRQRARARDRGHPVAPRAQRPREARRRLPRGRPRAAAPSCCRPSTASTASRSCRAAARSATRSTCPTRTAT